MTRKFEWTGQLNEGEPTEKKDRIIIHVDVTMASYEASGILDSVEKALWLLNTQKEAN